MYHITTNTGLDETFTDPTEVCDILPPHLVATCPHGRVEWTIDYNGPDLLWGSINTHQMPIPLDEAREYVHDIATSLLWIHHEPASPTRIDT